MGIELSWFARKVDEDVRLTILKALAMTADGRMNENMLREALDGFGHRRPLDYLHAQLCWLADNRVIRLESPGSVQIAEISRKGLDHIERRSFTPGIRIPRLAV